MNIYEREAATINHTVEMITHGGRGTAKTDVATSVFDALFAMIEAALLTTGMRADESTLYVPIAAAVFAFKAASADIVRDAIATGGSHAGANTLRALLMPSVMKAVQDCAVTVAKTN